MILLIFFLIVFVIILTIVLRGIRKRKKKKYLLSLANGTESLTPKEFFAMRKQNKNFGNFEGVYILYNKTKNMYYIGQSIHVCQRVNNHLTGHGNGDVYADYKYGSQFEIRLIALNTTKFKTLNELERNMIEVYDSYAKGYNKTRGNRG